MYFPTKITTKTVARLPRAVFIPRYPPPHTPLRSSEQVSRVESFEGMFRGSLKFNIDIGQWDTGSATSMRGMFSDAVAFNQDLSSWDVRKVADFNNMFMYAQSLNQGGFSAWDVSGAKNMKEMFSFAATFDQIVCWDLSVANTELMFASSPGRVSGSTTCPFPLTTAQLYEAVAAYCASTDDDERDVSTYGYPSTWDTSAVDSMANLFMHPNCKNSSAEQFNEDISDWNTSSVTDMSGMFMFAKSFNQDLSAWDVSRVMVRLFTPVPSPILNP